MKSYDVAVVGAGVFGAWTAWHLTRAGSRVVLLDAYGPAHNRSSSGGESRIIRMGYGKEEIYTKWARRSLARWQELSKSVGTPLFHRTGVLWLAGEDDAHAEQSLAVFEKLGIEHQRLSRRELDRHYARFDFGDTAWGLLEPESGALLARRAVEAVAADAVKRGAHYLRSLVTYEAGRHSILGVTAGEASAVPAQAFVFACGPWLPKIFPKLLGSRIFPTRQDVFFFGTPPGDRRYSPPALPIWIDSAAEAYGFPDLDGRGVKVARDQHGPLFDPDTGDRVAGGEDLRQVQEYVSRRLPGLRGAPVVESRVCQYENTSSGDFLIDRHPEDDRIWLVGGGSGHGFKHGPVLGEYAAAAVTGKGKIDPRFSLKSKQTVQKRAIF